VAHREPDVTTVQKWTGREARALREALRMSTREFAARLGIGERMVSKWEARGATMTPRPNSQALLDTMLAKAPQDALTRFEAALATDTPGLTEQVPASTALARTRSGGAEPLVGTIVPSDALQAEADLFDTLELTRLAGMSDISAGTIEALHVATDLLCRAYPTTAAAMLRDRAKKRLKQVHELLGKRTTIDQHAELLVIAGWIAALLGCVHYDLGEREEAEAARQAAYQWAKQAGHGELMGWAFEMNAWFSLVEGNYEQLIETAQAGQHIAGTSNAAVQLTLQEAKGWAYLGDRKQTDAALTRAAQMLERLPVPAHREHHFAFDRTKYSFYASTCYAVVGDNSRAEEHAVEVITRHTRPDGSSNAPMRVAQARIDLGIVAARRGDLDEAISYGESAFEFDRKSLADLVSRTCELDDIIQERYRGEQLAREFHERHLRERA
jgi:DNA-binding transcriptional regulator YiaG